ncbi:MAG: hypothetical protein Q8P22_13345, partial [Chloroflexota bacterium]|nr:hypothetical protein [Chloroflexota bacterium]
SKVNIVLAVPGFLIAYAWGFLEDRRPAPVLAFVVGCLMVAFTFEMFRLVELGSLHSYVENSRQVIHFYRTWRTIGGDESTIGNLTRQLKLGLGVIPLLLWVGFVAFERARTPVGHDPERGRLKLSLILLIAGLVHFSWWWTINEAGWIRHLVPGIVYFAVGLPVLASLSRMQLVRYSGLAVFVVVLLPQLGSVREFVPITRPEARLTALQDTASFLNSLDSEGVSLWGCGWWANRDLHLVGDLRFYDCSDQASVASHLRSGEQLILVRSEFFNWENNPNFAALAQQCDTMTLFRSEPFVVCDATPWLKSPTSALGP